MEKLKDGIWTSGEYEGRASYEFNSKIDMVVCMNSWPNHKALSNDRYEVYQIMDDYELIPVPYDMSLLYPFLQEPPLVKKENTCPFLDI